MSRYDDLESEVARLDGVIARAQHLLAALDTNDESDDVLYDALVEGIEIRKGQIEDCTETMERIMAPEYEATEREGWNAYQAR